MIYELTHIIEYTFYVINPFRSDAVVPTQHVMMFNGWCLSGFKIV